MTRLVVALLPLTIAACGFLQAKPDITRNYLLSTRPAAESAGRADVALAIGPISIPAYLDRAEIVTRVQSNEVKLSSVHRWAEPLRTNFARVLGANLAASVGTQKVISYPWSGRPDVDYRVVVVVEQFEATHEGAGVLIATWQLRKGVGGETIMSKRSTHSVPIDGSTVEDGVQALSTATARLAQEIAAAIPPLAE